MTHELRRRLALMLSGIAAMLVALEVIARVHESACTDAGGTWMAARRCVVNGATVPAPARAYVLGIIAGIVAAVVLWRTFSFYATRATRPPT